MTSVLQTERGGGGRTEEGKEEGRKEGRRERGWEEEVAAENS